MGHTTTNNKKLCMYAPTTTTTTNNIIKLNDSNTNNTKGSLLYNQGKLQKYILLCAQNMMDGGLRDKPSKGVDFYHTCYNLSGLSISLQQQDEHNVCCYGHSNNVIISTHPLFNISSFRVRKIIDVFYNEEEKKQIFF